jgi:hypothetical protein
MTILRTGRGYPERGKTIPKREFTGPRFTMAIQLCNRKLLHNLNVKRYVSFFSFFGLYGVPIWVLGWVGGISVARSGTGLT